MFHNNYKNNDNDYNNNDDNIHLFRWPVSRFTCISQWSSSSGKPLETVEGYFYRPDSVPTAQLTVWKHWRHHAKHTTLIQKLLVKHWAH